MKLIRRKVKQQNWGREGRGIGRRTRSATARPRLASNFRRKGGEDKLFNGEGGGKWEGSKYMLFCSSLFLFLPLSTTEKLRIMDILI